MHLRTMTHSNRFRLKHEPEENPSKACQFCGSKIDITNVEPTPELGIHWGTCAKCLADHAKQATQAKRESTAHAAELSAEPSAHLYGIRGGQSHTADNLLTTLIALTCITLTALALIAFILLATW